MTEYSRNCSICSMLINLHFHHKKKGTWTLWCIILHWFQWSCWDLHPEHVIHEADFPHNFWENNSSSRTSILFCIFVLGCCSKGKTQQRGCSSRLCGGTWFTARGRTNFRGRLELPAEASLFQMQIFGLYQFTYCSFSLSPFSSKSKSLTCPCKLLKPLMVLTEPVYKIFSSSFYLLLSLDYL